ncbi:putative family oxidoreductase [Rosellinia necatrix]|uniref:Putative family oxidoreductase n=1 Tax=Rosellinia necatrix TaxID=77044 RepID=A0A1S8A9D5_ROSNE|nr:putative family oxidoreductase [Rosellinia necatrix]
MSTTTVTSTIAQAPAPPGQPDISYHPDYEKWQARAAHRLRGGKLPKTIPAGFPEKLTGDLVWEGQSVVDTYNWTYVLTPEHLAEIDRAVARFKGTRHRFG